MPSAKWHLWLGIAVSVVMLFFLAWQVYRIDDPSGLIDELAGANYFFLIPRWRSISSVSGSGPFAGSSC